MGGSDTRTVLQEPGESSSTTATVSGDNPGRGVLRDAQRSCPTALWSRSFIQWDYKRLHAWSPGWACESITARIRSYIKRRSRPTRLLLHSICRYATICGG